MSGQSPRRTPRRSARRAVRGSFKRAFGRWIGRSVVTVALVGVGSAAAFGACGGSPVGAPVNVTVPPGASFRAAADSLEGAGVIRSARFFRWYAKFGGRDRDIKPGVYQLHAGLAWKEIIDALARGDSRVVTVTIPEGFDLRTIVPRLARVLSVPEDSIRAAVTDSLWRAEFNVPAETLEGYLFPDTYTFSVGITARRAVRAMLDRFNDVWQTDWDVQADAMGITRHEAVTMASLVEKEARVADERPLISAVYWNRVRIGMRLQADPTVQYALPEHVDRVLYSHLEVASPYNTYQNEGLPPGPIASPGAASLEAALKPADVPYLFFVAHPDGHHEFRRTFAEHQAAIAYVRRLARQRAAGTRP